MATKEPESRKRRIAPAPKKDLPDATPAAKTVRPRRTATKESRATLLEPTALFTELQAIVAEARPPEAVKRGLTALERSFRPRSTFAVIHDVTFDRLTVAAAKGRADARVAAASPGEGPVGRAFSSGEPVVEPRGGLVAVPMVAFGKTVGVVALIGGAYEGEGGPSADELERIRAVANACAAASEIARTRNDADRRARELEAAAERLREGDRTRDAMLSHLSHELRTPLTTIKGYLAMALKGRLGELNDKQRQAFATSERNADRLLRLINDLILTARLQAGKMTLDPKPLGLRGVLNEAIQFLAGDADATGVRMALEAPAGEVYIRGNRDRLVEGFMHLLERGLRGKREGERIHIRLMPRGRIGSVEIFLGGVSVPEAELSKMFDPFRTESGGSPNIGLSIARQIFDLHGGHLAAEHRGDGLVFQVAVPLFAGVVAGPAEAPEPRRGEIVLVEDDDDCRNSIIQYLDGENFRVAAYSDGREALRRIQEVPPALVLLDLRIPGVDGAELVKTVRGGSRGQHTPIFVISGAIDAASGTDTAWGETVDGVFEKPINYSYLVERIHEYVEPDEAAKP